MDDIDRFGKDLDAMLSPKVIGDRLKARHTKTIAKAVVDSAHNGIGPQNVPYPAYSESYEKEIARAGGPKQWLKGIAGAPHMLDLTRFSISVSPKGRNIRFVWTAGSGTMFTIATVHNFGLPIGKGGPRKQREFMHFENTLNETTLTGAIEATMDSLAAQFSAGRTPK